MRKILLLGFINLMIAAQIQAQCVPDTTISDIVSPPPGSVIDTVNGETIVILPYGEVGVAYSETLHFKVPRDTTFSGQPAVIDSIRLVQINNLPSTLSVACTPSDCVFPGGTYGCATLSGIPATADSIELTVTVDGTFTLGGSFSGPISETFDGYYLVIKESSDPVSTAEERADSEFTPTLFPNPAKDKVLIDPDVLPNEKVKVQITNLIGRLVFEKNMVAKNEPIELDVSQLTPGVYLYTLSSDDSTFTGRFSISR